MKKFAYPVGRVVFFGWLLVASLVSTYAQVGEEIGIDRSNLTRESEAVQEKALQDIHALHATWFRDVLSGTTSQGLAKFVNEVKLAKQNNLKFLANVLASGVDYDEGYKNKNAGEVFRKRCGWSQGSSQLSQINLAKLAQRLRTQFDAVKAANLTIDGFEIGNEVDWICFNGDVPDGHTPTEAEWMTAVRGYAHFLRTAAEVIHDPRYFPKAKIITFGIAHGSDRWDHPAHHFSNPARMVAMLRNLDGFNYLDNAIYHVDGYGTHIYPDPDNLEQSVTDLVRRDAAILGPDKPFWITEWGLPSNKYPNKQGQTRRQAFRNFYAALDKLHIPFGPPFYYAYSPGGSQLIDAKGALLPEAFSLAVRTSGQSSPPAPAGVFFVTLASTGALGQKAGVVVSGQNTARPQLRTRPAGEPLPPPGGTDRQIMLDVQVTDKSGTAIRGLQEQDFTVLDNNQPRKIVSFRAVDAAASSTSDPLVEIVLVVDSVNSSFRAVASERDEVRKFLLQNGGKLAWPVSFVFFSEAGTMVQSGSSRDGNALAAIYDQHETGLRSVNVTNGGGWGAVERMDLSLKALTQIVEYEKTQTGRKLMIWLSRGWPMFSATNERLFNSVVAASTGLRQARITLYSVDPVDVANSSVMGNDYYNDFPKGVTSPSKVLPGNLGLQVLAVQSGGRVFPSPNDLTTAVSKCVADADAFYVLSFDAARVDRPDEYHSLGVTVDRPGITARARTGYYAQP